MLTWTLIVSLSYAFPGFTSREACIKAAQQVYSFDAARPSDDPRPVESICVPTPKEGMIVGSGR